MKKIMMMILAATAALAGMNIISRASETNPAEMEKNNPSKNGRELSLYDQGMAASRANDFPKALNIFERALIENPKNPDTLNMLAHCQGKVGKMDEAIKNYKRALELRPNFPEAREYLGEVYLEAALDQIAKLKESGDNAKGEFEDLKNDFKEAAKKL